MTFAVWSHHVPASRLIDGGYSIDGSTVIRCGKPLFEAETFEEAEAWRLARLEGVRHGLTA